MTIGILTFHFCDNFGAVLQSYALKRYLEKLGHKVVYIDYKPPLLLHRYDFIPNYVKKRPFVERLGFAKRAILNCKSWRLKKRRFSLFRKDYFSEVSFDNKSVDLIIVGSDQVWNPQVTGDYDKYYYANNVLKGKYAFYAVSCPPEYLNDYVLSNIRHNHYPIGVRESNMKERLSDFDIKSTHVVDPTLLLSSDEWNMLLKGSRLPQKYILSYYTYSRELKEMASRWSEKTGWDNLLLQNPFKNAGPIEFLTLFKNAELVLTGSFHGTVFSVIFHRPFIYFPYNNSRDDRILSLLFDLGLNAHVYSSDLNMAEVFKTDWNEVDSKLTRITNLSKGFIIDGIIHNYDQSYTSDGVLM